MPVQRLLVLTCCFLGTALLGARAMRPEAVPLRDSLSRFPVQIGAWSGQDVPTLSDDIVKVLGVNDYTNRIYLAPAAPPLSLYVGYYSSQRQGDTMHSPLNCLPGAGWQAVSQARAAVTIPGRPQPIVVNRFVIQKGLDRQVVAYWYQSHGRVVASEYWSKAYLVWDALRTNRSDAALVRVISPVVPQDDSDATTSQRVDAFVQVLFPHLERFLPS